MIDIGLIICQYPEPCGSIPAMLLLWCDFHIQLQKVIHISTVIGATSWLGLLQQSVQVRHT